VALLQAGHEVRALVLPGDPAPGLKNLKVERIAGDVLRPETLSPALAGCDAVAHAAGRVNLRACGRRAMYLLNVTGSRNVARAAKAARISRFVHVSSAGVLGANLEPRSVDENHPAPGALTQKHHYHHSKIMAEAAVAEELQGIVDVVMVLPGMLWGPGDQALSSTGYALRALRGETLYYTRSGGTNLLDVEDAARGVAAALLHGRPGERYLLAGENLTLETWCRLIATAAGKDVRVKPIPLALITCLGWAAETLALLGQEVDFSLDIRRQSGNYWWADGSKSGKELGFKPRYTSRETVERTLTWFKQNKQ
jgi:dihydroflavonol-4-reductase